MKRAIFLTLVLVAAAVAPVRAEVLDPAWEKFYSARRVFQMRLAEMANRRWPAYDDFFVAHRDLQLSYMERRSMIFYYLLKNQPARIIRDKGGEAFMSFSWSQEEDRGFRDTIPGYARLSDGIVKLEATTKKFRNRDVLKDKFARLEIDPEYLSLMRDTGRAIGAAEQELALSVKNTAKSTPASANPA